MVPRHFSRLAPRDFSAAMGVGAILTLAVPLGFGAGKFLRAGFVLAVLVGLLFAAATHAFVLAVDLLGISRATPVKNLSGIFGTVFGLWVLREYQTSGISTIGELLLGSALTAFAAYVIGGIGQPEGQAAKVHPDRRGFSLALLAAACFGFYLVPLRLSEPLGTGFGYFGLGVGMLFGLTLPRLLQGGYRPAAREFGRGALAGAIMAVGVLFGAPATKLIGLSVAWPISQLNTFIALAIGMLWLKEHDAQVARPRLLLATVCTLLGIALLALL